MQMLLTLISLLIISETIFTSHRPPLQVLNPNLLSVEHLDMELNARPWTIVDTLNVTLEDVTLTPEQQKQLDRLNMEQNKIIVECKTLYRIFIAEQKKIKANRSRIINETIESYRNLVKERVTATLQEQVITWYQSLHIPSAQSKTTQVQKSTTTANPRRRQRE